MATNRKPSNTDATLKFLFELDDKSAKNLDAAISNQKLNSSELVSLLNSTTSAFTSVNGNVVDTLFKFQDMMTAKGSPELAGLQNSVASSFSSQGGSREMLAWLGKMNQVGVSASEISGAIGSDTLVRASKSLVKSLVDAANSSQNSVELSQQFNDQLHLASKLGVDIEGVLRQVRNGIVPSTVNTKVLNSAMDTEKSRQRYISSDHLDVPLTPIQLHIKNIHEILGDLDKIKGGLGLGGVSKGLSSLTGQLKRLGGELLGVFVVARLFQDIFKPVEQVIEQALLPLLATLQTTFLSLFMQMYPMIQQFVASLQTMFISFYPLFQRLAQFLIDLLPLFLDLIKVAVWFLTIIMDVVNFLEKFWLGRVLIDLLIVGFALAVISAIALASALFVIVGALRSIISLLEIIKVLELVVSAEFWAGVGEKLATLPGILGGIGDALGALWLRVVPFLSISKLVGMVSDALGALWLRVVPFLSISKLVGMVSDALGALWEWLVPVLAGIGEFLAGIWETVEMVATVVAIIASVIDPITWVVLAIGAAVAGVLLVFHLLGVSWKDMWDGFIYTIKKSAEFIWGVVKGIGEILWDLFIFPWKVAWAEFKEWFGPEIREVEHIWHRFVGVLKGAWNDFVSVIKIGLEPIFWMIHEMTAALHLVEKLWGGVKHVAAVVEHKVVGAAKSEATDAKNAPQNLAQTQSDLMHLWFPSKLREEQQEKYDAIEAHKKALKPVVEAITNMHQSIVKSNALKKPTMATNTLFNLHKFSGGH